MKEDILTLIEKSFSFEKANLEDLTPLGMAFVGDAVGTLVIRTIAASDGPQRVEKLHRFSADLVSAAAQSQMMHAIQPNLTEEEHSIYRRGRNQKPVTRARHQSVGDYRRATGFEALIGYLYLTHQHERLIELMKIGYETVKAQEEE